MNKNTYYKLATTEKNFYQTKLSLKYLLKDIKSRFSTCTYNSELIRELEGDNILDNKDLLDRIMLNLYPALTFDKNIFAAFGG